MEAAASTTSSPPARERPRHRPWIGVLCSFLIPGSGIYLAGDHRSGVRWFLFLTAFNLLVEILAPLPAVPGLWVFVGLGGLALGLSLLMLVRSWRRVPRLGFKGWSAFAGLAVALSTVEYLAASPFVRGFNIPTQSMAPTVQKGDHLMAALSAYWFHGPRRGDVVIFRTEDLNSPLVPPRQFFIKRVAGLPGEQLQIAHGRLRINGAEVTEPAGLRQLDFAAATSPLLRNDGEAFTVPDDSYFVVGDNTTNSLDSRFFGPVPRRSIVGQGTKIYWPWARAGEIR